MIPILFEPSERDFKSQGLGALSDAISCTVTEERNGAYELEMQYPKGGIHFEEIKDRCIIYAIPSPYRVAQPFRIYRITRPMNGIVIIYAQHISYDLNGVPLNPFSAGNVSEAMLGLQGNAAVDNPFTFWTDKATIANFSVTVPSTTRSVLGGQTGSILDAYGGEYEWDGFVVKLHGERGQDNGVVIRYGKNLTDIEQDRNISNVATGIYPYWTGGEDNLVTCSPKVVPAPGTYDFIRVVPVDFSEDFEEAPTPGQLQERAEGYVIANKIGVPIVKIKASFVQLEQSEEYKGLSLLERCDLCDTVTIQFEELGIDVKAEIVQIETDVLLERYNSVEIGDARSNIADTIASQSKEIANKPNTSKVERIANSIAADILGANGGTIRLLDTNGDGDSDTLYIADNSNPALAKKVWRFNYEGWGASVNGYDGPFTIAASLENGLYADFMAAGTLNASLIDVVNLSANSITSGILRSKDGSSYFDLNNGELNAVGSLKSVTGDGRYIEVTGAKIDIGKNGKNYGQIDGDETFNGEEQYIRIIANHAIGIKTPILATTQDVSSMALAAGQTGYFHAITDIDYNTREIDGTTVITDIRFITEDVRFVNGLMVTKL